MMLTLILNVLDHARNIRFAHRERCIAILPAEVRQHREFFANPFGRVAFEILRDLKGSDRGWGRYQRVDVICKPSHLQGDHPMLASNTADELPYPLLDLRQQPGLAI